MIKNILSSKKLWWVVGAVTVVVLIAFALPSKKDPSSATTTTVKRGSVIQEVSVTGRVKPTTEVNSSFEKVGRIQNVYVKVGDHVAQGALLAEIESSSAQANLMEVSARLAELKRGARPEEVTVKEAELAKYTQDLSNSYEGVLDTVNDGFTKSDDALHAKTAGMFSGFKTTSYNLTFATCDDQLKNTANSLRQSAETDFENWQKERNSYAPSPSKEELVNILEKTSAHLEITKLFLETTNRTLTLDCVLGTTSLDTYRTNINTARTNITTAIAAVNTKRQAIASLTLSAAKVSDELSLLRAGTAQEVVAAQEARVKAAEGELRKHRIHAEASGVITKVDATKGELSSTAKSSFSIISDSSFEIETNVPEADIAKISTGNTARVTLDAYGSDTLFEARVVAIDPAETIIENVPTYKAALHFSKSDPRIKSGMTANVDIATARKDDTLIVPQRAIITRDGTKFVRIIGENNTSTETPVTVGLKGSDGNIEILSGVTEGTRIAASPL